MAINRGRVKIEEFAPNHPFAHNAIIVGVKRPPPPKTPAPSAEQAQPTENLAAPRAEPPITVSAEELAELHAQLRFVLPSQSEEELNETMRHIVSRGPIQEVLAGWRHIIAALQAEQKPEPEDPPGGQQP